jgi:hypothetical protein
MPRIHFIEIHEQPWFPSSMRDGVTDALQFGLNLSRVYGPIAPLLQRVLDSTRSGSIVDLCSGGGGPWFDLVGKVESRNREGHGSVPQVWLTDKYPNHGARENLGAASESPVAFYPGSVDATSVPAQLKGVRTMFTSFHHFSPDGAQAILQNAVDAGEGIAVFEVTRRHPVTIALVNLWVLMLIVGTPWIRPFRWSRLFWTYFIPIIPISMFFDGTVSCLRTYRPQELRDIAASLTGQDYEWEAGEQSTGKVPVTYLIGSPRRSASG